MSTVQFMEYSFPVPGSLRLFVMGLRPDAIPYDIWYSISLLLSIDDLYTLQAVRTYALSALARVVDRNDFRPAMRSTMF